MKMKNKNLFLILLLFIFLVGIVLTITGIAFGGRLYSYQIEAEDTNFDSDDYQSSPTTLSTEDADSIKGIDFDIQTSSVNIVAGDNYSISGQGRYKSYVENGIWYVKTKSRKAHITFLTHTIDIPYFWNHEEKYNINTITIPSDSNLNTADIKVSAGSLNGDKLSADDIILKIGAGSLKLNQIAAKDLNVKVGAGEAVFDNITVTGSCDAKVGAGQIELGTENIPSGINTIANLQGKCSAGEMDIVGKLTGNADLDCSTGDMDLLLDGTRANYSIKSNSSLGDIDVDDDDDPFVSEKNNEHFGNLTLKCSLGEISVEFQH